MLVFAPYALPSIFQSLITDFKPSLRNAEPANALYMLARFACLNCDDNWLEDLIIGATDAIEETFFVSTSWYSSAPFSTLASRTKPMTRHALSFGSTILPYGFISCDATMRSMQPARCLGLLLSLRKSSIQSLVNAFHYIILIRLTSVRGQFS